MHSLEVCQRVARVGAMGRGHLVDARRGRGGDRDEGGQVGGVGDTHAVDRHGQVGDFLAAAQQRAVDHLDEARAQGSVVTDFAYQMGDAHVRIFGGFAHAQGHFRQGGENQLILKS